MNEILDISIHLPEEYEGKCVIFNKVEYIIGKFVSQGASKIVHKLINKKSNICSHVIKIHRDISDKYLLYNELLGQSLCRKMRVPSMQIFLADNGDKTYHIQELVTFNRECNSVLLKKGKSAFENKKYDEAYSIFQELLNNENPFNTEALLGIFLCSAIENGSEEHRDILEKVIEIEPNSSYYYEFLYLYLLKWKRYDEAKLLFEKSKIEVNFEISDLINNGNHIESLQAMIDKQLEKHIINYYSLAKIITLGEILKEHEDKVAFFRLFDKYKKTNDKVIFNSLASIAKDNPKTKIFFEICLSIAFECGLYFSLIDLYEKAEVDLGQSFDIMALQAYINVGQAEKLIPMISQKDFELELKQEMETIIDKKRQYNQLSTYAFELFLSEKKQEAFDIQKQACDTYPWGYASILNRLLYYIYKKEKGEIQYAPTRGGEDFVYYILHLIIYYLITNNQDGIKKIDVLTPTFYNFLLQIKEKTGTIPSRIGFYHETGLLEYPIRETANFLKKYGDKRGIRDVYYDKIVALYQREGAKQEIPGDYK